KGIKIKELLEKMIALVNLDLEIVPDPARMRPSDVELLIGSYEKFHAATGWEPSIPLEQTLKDLLDYWRSRIL
ncbi:MAG: GDP-mannose 4,6 dehydratase, partial [candidate division WOR-3 bacterium]